MKYLFLTLLFLTLLFSSCSDDDDNSNTTSNPIENKVTFKFNNQSKNFETVSVSSETIEELDYWVLTASDGTSNNVIEFTIEKNKTGLNTGPPAPNIIDLTINGENYRYWENAGWGNFTLNIITNNNEVIVGTFIGTVVDLSDPFDDSLDANITEGNISYSFE